MSTETRGQARAAARIRELAPAIERVRQERGRAPALAVVAGGDAVNQRFVAIKRTAFERAGLQLHGHAAGASSGTAAVLAAVRALNDDPGIDGIFLQFPLPGGIDAQRCADGIARHKDIDASSADALGRLLTGGALYVPAAAGAVIDLLEDGLGELVRRTVLVVGGDGVIERLLVLLCAARGAVCGITAPGDAALADQVAGVDAVILTDALPAPEYLRQVRQGAVLIDAAYAQPPRPAGWLPPRVREQLGAWHPQYGSVGPLTVALLMEATVRAAIDG